GRGAAARTESGRDVRAGDAARHAAVAGGRGSTRPAGRGVECGGVVEVATPARSPATRPAPLPRTWGRARACRPASPARAARGPRGGGRTCGGDGGARSRRRTG